jgi:PAS domain S-box-containing protein
MMPPGVAASSPAGALLRTVWASAIPATLQGPDFRLLDVNQAFAELVGEPRQRLIGRDPLDLQPPEDREANRRERATLAAHAAGNLPHPPAQRRLVDAQGRLRWFTLLGFNLATPGARALWLALLQDQSPELAARQQAERAESELAQWFELSVGGMLVYDHTGLIVRSNAAFEALAEHVPEVLGDARPNCSRCWAGTTARRCRPWCPGRAPWSARPCCRWPTAAAADCGLDWPAWRVTAPRTA